MIKNLNSGFFKSKKNYLLLEINLKPKRILIKVKKLIPPSIGIQGGGQQGGPPGIPGWENVLNEIKINKIVVNNLKLIFILQNYLFC